MKKRVGILRGGNVDNYEKSLKDGGDIFLCIHENLSDRWQPVDLLIDRNDVWHADGIPLVEKNDLVHKVDVIWNATHPSFSGIFESMKIPHFSIDSFSHAISENRNMLKDHMKAIGVRMSRHVILPAYFSDLDGPRERYSIKKAKEIFERFGAPWIVKPLDGDPSMGVHVAQTFPELVDAIEDGVNHGKSILIEEFINGRNAEVHTLSGFRDKEVYTFPFGNFPSNEKEKLESLSQEIFQHMGVTHYLKSDFRIHPKGKIYFTGVELMPSFRQDSKFSQSSEFVGAKMHQVIEHILERTLNGAII